MGNRGSDDEPPSKRSKHEEAELDVGGPMYNEDTARKMLETVGFDPDDVHNYQEIEFWGYTPMSYFCLLGDLKMCRYLLSKGASTTESWSETGNGTTSPMIAACRGGNTDVCKWLYENGGSADVGKENIPLKNPLYYASRGHCTRDCRERGNTHDDYREICCFLVLNGALGGRDGPALDRFVRKNLYPERFSYHPDFPYYRGRLEGEVKGIADERKYLLKWAEEEIRSHDGFSLFLMGTNIYEPPTFSEEGLMKKLEKGVQSTESAKLIIENLSEDNQMVIWKNFLPSKKDCVLQCLSGQPEIRQNIARFVGLVSPVQLRLLQQLAASLRKYLEVRPYQKVDESDSSSEEWSS